ncbi:hypothetical protein DFQ27_008060 [Actinomortierella ambigua]|uniref:Translation initiation factor IF-2, mitochondrial n=1 Tax=Actinomortierella ambigua TaxID=1343610 RepID=A0A9P6PS84_9FUNG|nr:hypothetical protein DFQ27_008060 [Actinomortierella ambigua]
MWRIARTYTTTTVPLSRSSVNPILPTKAADAQVTTILSSTRFRLASRYYSSGDGSSGGRRVLGDRIVIDENNKARMELRKQVMRNESNTVSGRSQNEGSDKWRTRGPNNEGGKSPYRRAHEEQQQRGFGRRNQSSADTTSDAVQQRRPGRYVDQKQQDRRIMPASFGMGGNVWGAPSAAPKAATTGSIAPPPSSFATSGAWGFQPPKVSNPAPSAPEVAKAAPKPTQHTPSPVDVKAAPAPIAATPKTQTVSATQPQPPPPPPRTNASPMPSSSSASSRTWQTKPPTATSGPKRESTRRERAQMEVARRVLKRKKQKKAKDVFIPDAITVSNLASLLGARIGHFEKTMRACGMEITRHDHVLTSDEASLLALEYNTNPILGSQQTLFDLVSQPEPEDMSIHPLRPPVVTIMGHVDHGKTTLLDALRKTSVAAGEAGGITQHIGAFSVLLPSKQRITFLDTPGHPAFTAMRARGAQTTDIVVLVVAAEDGVMPQTAEAIKHAEEAGVPIIVAINKCDKYGAEPEKAKQALLKYGVTVEDLGGETQCVEVSGLTGKNLDLLEEAILTLSEVLDLRAEVDIRGEGHIIESQMEKGRGNVATVLVKRGTLRVGDTIVAGTAWCKVKALTDDTGRMVKEAPPGTPIKVTGWKDLPKAGDELLSAESEEQAKQVVENRELKKERQDQLRTLVAVNEKRRLVAEEEDEEKLALKEYKRQAWLFHQGALDKHPDPLPVKKQLSVAAMQAMEEAESDVKHLRMVVKGDVSGTVEAVVDTLSSLPDDQVKVSVIQNGVGNITEGDIQFAASCQALILGFNVKADKKLQQAARQAGVKIKNYNVIYKLLDDVKVEMAELLPKDIEIQVLGEAKIAQVFNIKKKGGDTQSIAGCRITNGSITRKEDVRIVRNGEVIWDGPLAALKRVKEDIQEAKKGTECGMEFGGFEDLKEGDVIQSIKKMEVLRKL